MQFNDPDIPITLTKYIKEQNIDRVDYIVSTAKFTTSLMHFNTALQHPNIKIFRLLLSQKPGLLTKDPTQSLIHELCGNYFHKTETKIGNRKIYTQMILHILKKFNINPNESKESFIYSQTFYLPIEAVLNHSCAPHMTKSFLRITQDDQITLAKTLITFSAHVTNKHIKKADQNGDTRLSEFLATYPKKIEDLFSKVKNKQIIDWKTIDLPLLFVRDTNGNSVLHAALTSNNLNVFNKIISINTELLHLSNFSDEKPVDHFGLFLAQQWKETNGFLINEQEYQKHLVQLTEMAKQKE